MHRTITVLTLLLSSLQLFAGRISGTIRGKDGRLLPYASVQVKGTMTGTNANNEGRYYINLDPGSYTLVCQHVGYQRVEKAIRVNDQDLILDFNLEVQELTMPEVVVKQGEDPAYAIIRNAIRKRPFYRDQVKAFQCEVYTKGQLKLRDFPKKFMGKPVELETGDTSKRQMIYLSETIATYSVREPNDVKVEVVSTKVSGQNDGFGLAAPTAFSFYENNIRIGSNLNPRGFISPISSNALNYYRYRYEGAFIEDGKEISRIRVIPKRKYEPLFSGYINIVEEDWRIHSLQLQLLKESQMEFVDTLRIEQLYVPVTDEIWFIKSQVIYPAIKIFGFDAHGSFINIYSKLNLEPEFAEKFFNSTVLKYTDSSNKKDSAYWVDARPVPLLEEEVKDYKSKDSMAVVRKDPAYLDSIDRRSNRFSIGGFLLTGEGFSNSKKRSHIFVPSLLELVQYNTIEGLVMNPRITYTKRIDTGIGRRSISITPALRYGFSNRHFNAYATVSYNFGKKYFNNFTISGGSKVFQFNNTSFQGERGGTLSALLFERNRRKLYEAWFGRIRYAKQFGEGLSWLFSLQYQDRMPLVNTSDYTWRDLKNRTFTPNYPEEFTGPALMRHQALIGSVTINWQPGNKYIEFPDRKISIGSRYPVFSFNYTKGLDNILGSDIDYDKWRFSISDNLNLKLAGRLSYNLSTGGFLNNKKVQVPDYFHLNGNLSTLAAAYMMSYQLVPHYKFSNTDKHFSTAHIEYHLNGFITNKIPPFRQLNWYLVTGTNAFYRDRDLHYFEIFAGFENILKTVRIDFVQGFLNGKAYSNGIRIGVRGITGGNVDD